MRRVLLTCVLLAGCADAESDELALDRAALPEVELCDGVRDWPAAWERDELAAIDRIDALRERGADCGTKGRGSAAPALRVSGALTCAARAHAVAMAEQAHTGHVTPDEVDTAMRIAAVEYDGAVIEHFAAGPETAEEVVDGVWRVSDFHCIDLLAPDHIDVGIGLVGATMDGTPYTTYWVVLLGDPPGGG